MLPNHTPLRVAEVFHTLETLHPGSHRSRPGSRSWHRPGDVTRAQAVRRRTVSGTGAGDAGALAPAVSARASVRLRASGARWRDAAADLGAGLQRRDGGVCRVDGHGLRIRAAFQPDAAGSGRFAPTANTFGRRRSSPRRTSFSASRSSARRLPRRPTTWPRPRILAGFASIVVSFSRCPARKRRAATSTRRRSASSWR